MGDFKHNLEIKQRVDIERHPQIRENLLLTRIQYIGGVIDSENIAHFKRLVIRVSRCQVYVHTFELNVHEGDQIIGDTYDEKKHIFILAF